MTGQMSTFGAGFMFAIPTGSSPTPAPFAALQNVTVDWKKDAKSLHGSQQFALEVGMGKMNVGVKAEIGRIDPNFYNSVFFGMSVVAGQKLNSVFESGTIPATPFTITVTNGATFATDLGVYNTITGKFMTRVASGPTTGQYSVNTTTGAYLFAAADTLQTVKLSYTYTSSGTGYNIVGTNPQMGAGPTFALYLVNTWADGVAGSKSQWLNFPAAKSTALTMPFKQDDFLLPGIEMMIMDDGTGNPFNYSASGPG